MKKDNIFPFKRKPEDIEKMVEEGMKSWAVIKADLPGHKEFLDGSYLVLVHSKGQMVLGKGRRLAPGEVECQEGLSVEVRFPTVDIEAIQKLKAHVLVDRSRTPMTPASIRVVLKTDPRRTG